MTQYMYLYGTGTCIMVVMTIIGACCCISYRCEDRCSVSRDSSRPLQSLNCDVSTTRPVTSSVTCYQQVPASTDCEESLPSGRRVCAWPVNDHSHYPRIGFTIDTYDIFI